MRSLAVVAAALVLVLVACDSTEPQVYAAASAREVTLLGIASDQTLDLTFRYVGDTPSPCYAYSGYGTSTTLPPGERDPEDARRIEVDVNVVDRSEGVCTGDIGTVEAELRVPVREAGLYVVAFERAGQGPLERTVRVTLGAAVVEDE
ncbi:hypothetical protein [Rubrivirga sp. IMCC45206]|uniref:hypothetical protein n=1 Tax=Rubrivirga sp. IMCC45206 TaxID=3391614 RepID=UPI00398F9328